VLEECVASVGLERLQCLHVNDSKTELGSNRDRHASLTEGEIGADGLAAFLSEPRFQELPTILETPGPSGTIGLPEVQLARKLREMGLAARDGRGGRKRPPASRAGRRKRG
jgi:deoxyribonuclease-4